MAISVINSTTYNGRVVGTTGFAVNISGFTLADGDCLFAILGSGDDIGTGWAAVQDGWASLGAASTTTGNDAAFGVMRHFIDTASGEPTSITFQRIGNTGTDNFAAIVIQVRGVDPVVPTENAAVEFTVSNDPTPNNVDIETFTDNDAVLVAHLYSDAATVSGSPTLGAPSGYTGITAVTYSDGTNVQGIFMQAAIDTDVGTAGTQSIGSWTTGGSPASSVESYTAAIAIRPEGAPLADGVYYDRGSKSSPSSSAGTFTWDHDPRNVLSGLVVAVVNHQSASDVITAVKAGGVDMTPISGGSAVDSATEPGRVQTYFLSGSDLPDDDPITIAVTRTGTNNIVGYAAGVYSTTGETDITGVATISADDSGGTVAGSEQNVDDGTPSEGVSLRLAFGYTGRATPSPAGANSILRQSYDRGANGSSFVTEANSGNGSRPVGFSGAADDYAAVYLAVIPVASEPSTVTGDADLTATGTLTGQGVRETLGASDLTATGTLAATGTVIRDGAAGLTGAGTITAAGYAAIESAAALTATGTLEAAGVRTRSGAADLTATGNLTGAGYATNYGAVGLDALGTLTATGGHEAFASTGLTGSGALVAYGYVTDLADALLTATGILAASGYATKTGAADLDGTGTLAANGDVEGSVTGTAELAGTGALSATGDHETLGAADLAATGSLVSAGQREVFAIAGLDASGTLAATGEHEATGAAALTGAGTLTADGDVTAGTIHGAAGLTGTGTVTASGLATGTGTATLTGTGTLTATGERIRFAAVSLIASGALAATGEYEAFGVLPLAAVGTLGATADDPLRFGAADLDGTGTLVATAAEVGWTYNADTAATYGANADWSYTGGTAVTYGADTNWIYGGGTAATYGADTDWSYGGTADLTATYGG